MAKHYPAIVVYNNCLKTMIQFHPVFEHSQFIGYRNQATNTFIGGEKYGNSINGVWFTSMNAIQDIEKHLF